MRMLQANYTVRVKVSVLNMSQNLNLQTLFQRRLPRPPSIRYATWTRQGLGASNTRGYQATFSKPRGVSGFVSESDGRAPI